MKENREVTDTNVEDIENKVTTKEALIWERDYYKLRFEELNKQWNKVIDEILGEDYYNYGCDWKSCDRLTTEDIIKVVEFWKKIV